MLENVLWDYPRGISIDQLLASYCDVKKVRIKQSAESGYQQVTRELLDFRSSERSYDQVLVMENMDVFWVPPISTDMQRRCADMQNFRLKLVGQEPNSDFHNGSDPTPPPQVVTIMGVVKPPNCTNYTQELKCQTKTVYTQKHLISRTFLNEKIKKILNYPINNYTKNKPTKCRQLNLRQPENHSKKSKEQPHHVTILNWLQSMLISCKLCNQFTINQNKKLWTTR